MSHIMVSRHGVFFLTLGFLEPRLQPSELFLGLVFVINLSESLSRAVFAVDEIGEELNPK